ncbi:MAG TPA: hypothetical protein VFQ02_12230 [Nitrospira sp.]|nr:hypothetical protein [Nitrospira sp.]
MTHLTRLRKSCMAYPLAVAVSAMVGCAGGPSQHDPSWKTVPITDVSMVVGEWDGTVTKNHAMFPEGSVRLIIRDNSTYLFAGESLSSAAVGSGGIEPREGRLIGDTDHRAVTFTLYEHKGARILMIDSTNKENGTRYRGEFSKVR